MQNAFTFGKDLDDWLHRTEKDLEALARQSIQELAERVVIDTPFDLGNLRAHWQPALNRLPGKQDADDAPTPDPTGNAASGRIVVTVAGIKLGDTFFMVNNAAYAMRLEFGFVGPDSLGRVYNQKGRFYVAKNIARWDQIVAGQARDLGFEVL